jgi:release factor glutamine methyltransferase
LRQGDVFNGAINEGPFDLVIANPPYIALADFALLAPEIREYEPRIATTDDGDGLKFIRHICTLASKRLKRDSALFVEIAHNQGADAKRIAVEAGLEDAKVFKDLAGNDRILHAQQHQ